MLSLKVNMSAMDVIMEYGYNIIRWILPGYFSLRSASSPSHAPPWKISRQSWNHTPTNWPTKSYTSTSDAPTKLSTAGFCPTTCAMGRASASASQTSPLLPAASSRACSHPKEAPSRSPTPPSKTTWKTMRSSSSARPPTRRRPSSRSTTRMTSCSLLRMWGLPTGSCACSPATWPPATPRPASASTTILACALGTSPPSPAPRPPSCWSTLRPRCTWPLPATDT